MKLEASADSEGTSFFPFFVELIERTARNAELQDGAERVSGLCWGMR